MNKKIIITAGIFIILLLATLLMYDYFRNSYGVKSVTFYVNSGALAPQYYWETELNFTPDYELKTLTVEYSKIYPQKGKNGEIDIDTDGIIGGEYFDRFEAILVLLKNYEIKEDAELLAGAGKFTITVEKDNKQVQEYEFGQNLNPESYAIVNEYYSDVTALFTENVN